jgi:hypothetical protein
MKLFKMIPRALFCGVLPTNLCLLLKHDNCFDVLQIDATCPKNNTFCVNVRPCLALRWL